MEITLNGEFVGAVDEYAGQKILDYIKQTNSRIAELEQIDSEAAQHVESVIVMRTGFTGEPPYVGWKGLGLALTEKLDDLETRLAKALEIAKEMKYAGWHKDLLAVLEGKE